ncbi:hypothetical protein CEXT_714681 [Caerostris extrusa]|uniref:Uncharacterized protein n=1 Tax=Caerostris extrusa TaxID=172846 RepID=A0AAV4PKR5_CAEEX|nr:hypothetical protein CEXT_714681 [Caerostris extrusa]
MDRSQWVVNQMATAVSLQNEMPVFDFYQILFHCLFTSDNLEVFVDDDKIYETIQLYLILTKLNNFNEMMMCWVFRIFCVLMMGHFVLTTGARRGGVFSMLEEEVFPNEIKELEGGPLQTVIDLHSLNPPC